MRRGLTIGAGLLVLAAAGLLWHGRRQSSPRPPALRVAFPVAGLLRVQGVPRGASVTVTTDAGQRLASQPAFDDGAVDLRLPWRPGAAYRVHAADAVARAVAPVAPVELSIRVHAPLGQRTRELEAARPFPADAEETLTVAAAPGETVDLMLELEKRRQSQPLDCHVDIRPPTDQPSLLAPAALDAAARLTFEFDKAYWSLQARLGPVLPTAPLTIRIRVGAGQWRFAVRFVPRRLAADTVTVTDWRLPTDSEGRYLPQRLADQISMPNHTWSRLAAWFNVRPRAVDYFEPFAFQTLWLHNAGDQPVSLLAESVVTDIDDARPLAAFRPPTPRATGGTGRGLAFCHLPPGGTRACVLPIYVQPDTSAGTYLRRVTLTPLGSDRVLKHLQAPLGVTRANSVFSAWTAGVSLLSVVWLAAVCIGYHRLVRSLGLRLVVLLALLGSLQFCLQFVGGLVSTVLYAFLGPFNCLVGGLLTEVMTYLLVTSILFLVPRVGAMTLAGLVTYVMGGIMFGSFGLTDLLFVGSGMAFRELLLFAFGVTSFHPRRDVPAAWRMMLALGLADAAATFTSLALFAVFYRLFYADWYVGMQVAITGFCYTVVGVYLGRSLGATLRKVHT